MKIQNKKGRELELSDTTISQIEQLTGRTIYQVIAKSNLLNNDPEFWTITYDEFCQAGELETAVAQVGRYHRNVLIFYRRWMLLLPDRALHWLHRKRIINIRSWIVY